MELIDFKTKKFDIIIIAGQSNASGSGRGYVDDPYIEKENVWVMRDFVISLATEQIAGNNIKGCFALSFVDEYLKNEFLAPNREILIINAAKGTSGFDQNNWNRDGVLSTKMIQMTKVALDLNPDNKLIAFLWHQGERSVNFNMPPEKHFEYMKILLDDLRQNFGSDFKMIGGDFVPIWKQMKGEHANKIAEMNQKVFLEFGGQFVNTQGLTSNDEENQDGDKIHFSRKGLQELGERYFEKFAQ